MQLFGTAGIRGITNRDITPDFAVKVGMAYGTVFNGNIAVARDTRFGAQMIQQAVISGLQSSGNQVYNLGIIPLPIFARYVADFMDGGIIVTGSHTPPDIIGIVCVDSLGRDIPRDISNKIEKIFFEERFKKVAWDKIKDEIEEDAIENYMKFIEKFAKNVSGFKIVIDTANGCGAGVMNRILENLGITVKCLNCERKKIPNRPSEPRKENLRELVKQTKNFALGAGVDVDADRVVFSTRNNTISEDVIGAIFAKREVKEKMVTPINSSSLIERVAKEYGFEVIYCPVGPPEIAEAILKNNANFGYEETGKYIFPPHTLWGDSILSIVKILDIMDKEGKTIEELVDEFPKYYQIKEKIKVKREKKKEIVEKIGEYLEKNTPKGVVKILRVDGVKLIYEDSWLLIRASGTEDVIRVFSDARNENDARALVNFGKRILKKFIS